MYIEDSIKIYIKKQYLQTNVTHEYSVTPKKSELVHIMSETEHHFIEKVFLVTTHFRK